MNEWALGIDLGSTGVRCLVVDLKGRPVSLCSGAWSSYTPKELLPLGKELDPQKLWKVICEVSQGALRAAGKGKLIGLSVTAQREGAVFLNREGRELYAGPNLDLRALAEGASIDQELGEKIHSLTGHLPSFLFVPAKLRWFENHRRQVYNEIATVLSLDEWVIYRLTGERVGEACSLGELGLIQVGTRQRSLELEGALRIPQVYPGLAQAGEMIGKISQQVAAQTGLPEGAPVALGAPDTQCGLLGLGLREAEEAGIIAGWSCPCCLLMEKPIFDQRLWTGCYPFPQRWILESNAGDLGGTWHWLAGVLGGEEKEMGRLVEEAPQDSSVALAFLSPLVMDMTKLGMRWGGFLFPLPPEVTEVDRASLLRAALESFCFTIKANLLQLEEASGVKPARIGLAGGLAQNQVFARTLPQVLGQPVFLSQLKETSALGAAICGAAGSGRFASLEEAQEAMKPKLELLEPEPSASLEYASAFEKWSRLAEVFEEELTKD